MPGPVQQAAAPRAAAPPPAPPRPGPAVSVVLCTLGRQAHLVEAVRAVLAQSSADLELLVVDNDPASGLTGARLAGVSDPRLTVVAEPRRGLSAARNRGLAAARADLVAFTDDDAVPDRRWVESLVAVLAHDHRREVAGVTGRVLAARTATSAERWFEEAGLFDKGTSSRVWSLCGEPAEVHGAERARSPFVGITAGEVGTGNNMLFRTSVLRALGGFDELLGAGSAARGGEDLDVFRRALHAGHVLVYAPQALVRHHHRETLPELRAQLFGYGVGLTAVLTKVLLSGGSPARALLVALPRGVRRLLARRPRQQRDGVRAAHRCLLLAELAGCATGPVLYLAGLVASRARGAGRRAPAAAGRSVGAPSRGR